MNSKKRGGNILHTQITQLACLPHTGAACHFHEWCSWPICDSLLLKLRDSMPLLLLRVCRCAAQASAAPDLRPCATSDASHTWACYAVALLVAVLWAGVVAVLAWRALSHRRTGVYMLDFACFAPPRECALRSCDCHAASTCQAG